MELILIGFLAACLVVSNLGWIYYLINRDEREQDERRELQNRIARPEVVVQKAYPKFEDKQDTASFNNATDLDELAAVGHIDPTLSRNDG